jgi:hypothetical protein
MSPISNSKSPIDKSPPVPLSPSPPLFSVRTPTAVVTDLGTEFGVEVDKNNGSRVHVFVGVVDFAPAGKPSCGVRIAAGGARRISAANGATVENIALDSDRFARPRAMLAGKFRHGEILFQDTFETFALGTRWQGTRGGPPDDVLKAVSEDGRTALWMRNKPSVDEPVGRTIETIEPFPLQDLAAIRVDVVFKPSKKAPSPFEIWILGSSGKMVRVDLQPNAHHRIRCNAIDVSDFRRWVGLAGQDRPSPAEVYQNGRRYRSTLSVNRQGVELVLRDDVNLAVVYQTDFKRFTLADLGDSVRVLIRCSTCVNVATECWIYEVTVRGRPSATHYPPSKSKDIPRPTSSSRPPSHMTRLVWDKRR